MYCKTFVFGFPNVLYKRKMEEEGNNVIMLKLDKQYTFTQVIGLYRQFKIINEQTQLQSFRKQLSEITTFIHTDQRTVVVGDFNLDYVKMNEQTYTHRRIYDELLEMSYAFDLTQMVKEITWMRLYNNHVRKSTLDHIYTNNQDLIDCITVQKREISDHSLITCTTKGYRKSNRWITYEYNSWQAYSKEALQTELQTYDFGILSTLGAQDIANKLDHILGTLHDKMIIMKQVKKPVSKLNFSSHIIEMKKKHNNLYKRARRESNSELLKRARAMEKNIRKEIVKSKETKIKIEASLGSAN